MTIGAILFDLWGTLVHDPAERSRPRQVWRALNVQQTLRDHGIEAEFTPIDEALVEASTTLMTLHDRGIDVSSLGRVDLFLAHLSDLRTAGLGAEGRRAIESLITTMHPDLGPLLAEDAIETLKDVRGAGLRTVLVSNAGFTTAPHLRTMLEENKAASYFDAMVFSDDELVAKPNPRIFQRALEHAGCDPEHAVFVGDFPHNDIRGAQAAGIFAVQIGNAPQGDVRPQAQIASLSELMPLLRTLGLIEAPQAV